MPLGLVFTPEELAPDADDAHFGVFDETSLLGCLTEVDVGPPRTKIRQVAVSPAVQGRGVGRVMMIAAESRARARGIQILELVARQSAQAFYHALGFTPRGPAFVHLGVPHLPMAKDLT